ncbi:MAG: ATP-binding protein [Deltaproteobacteria bacterium]|nr:ATP-binding protein [Deltaproteobacteria bacterium]
MSEPGPEQHLLEEDAERFRTLYEHAPVMIDSFDAEGRCLLWNRECERMLGWTREELEALKDPLRVFYPDEVERNRVLASINRADGQYREYQVVAKDGSIRRQLWADFRLPTGEALSVGHDVTEQRQMEVQLRHTQKLDALGRLSGGISHDFNNLLTVVLVNTQLLERLVGDSPAALERTTEIQRAARRGGELVRKLMAFGRKEMLHFEPLDLPTLVRDLAGTLRRLIPERIEIELELAEDTPYVRADAGAIEQIIINLATNARDAIEGQGILRIETFRWSGPERDLAVMAVSDSGPGLSVTERDRIFEPFFTTKPPGEGSGMGLAMVYGLVQQHGAEIEVTETGARGTTLEVRFPEELSAPLIPPASSTTLPEERTATVLIVEDERALREAARAVLVAEGHRVHVAGNGEQALALLRENPEVDLILSDVVMPRMGGLELYERLGGAEGRYRFVLTTGYPGMILDEGLGATILRKPWSLDGLIECVRQALA